MRLLSELKKIRVQHVTRGDDGLEVKTDVDVLTDASAVTMDGKDLKSGIGGMIDDRIGELIDGAPQELDTLKEIADELSKNQSGVTTILKKLGDKVDKDGNKVLSSNDFTNAQKTKLDGIEEGAQKNVVTSVNGQTGDVKIEAGNGNIDLSGYVKTVDLKNRMNIPLPNKKTLVLTQKEYDLLENKDQSVEYNIRTSDIRVLFITNQFFAGEGGSEAADNEPHYSFDDKAAASIIMRELVAKSNAISMGTLVVPDNALNNQYKDTVYDLIIDTVNVRKPDIIIFTPAFNWDKCAENSSKLCLFIMEKLGIPAVASIYPENEFYKKYKGLIYMVDASNSPVGMRNVASKIADYALQILRESYDKSSYIKKLGEMATRIIKNEAEINEQKKIKILTQSEYSELSDDEKNREDAVYFLV